MVKTGKFRREGVVSGWMMRWILCASLNGLAMLSASGAEARWHIEKIQEVQVEGRFEGELDISGLAMLGEGRCLAVSDETRPAQGAQWCVYDKDQARLVVGELLPLAPEDKSKVELDLEGVAADPDAPCFYATGSHGVSKKKGRLEAERCRVFRIAVDGNTFAPLGGGIQSASLLDVLRRDEKLGQAVGRPLQQRGLNIEGLAFKAGRLFFGVRSPNLQGRAFVVETDAIRLFSEEAPPVTVHELPMAAGCGSR